MVRETRSTVNVATQNVLLDYTRAKKGLILPQDERIDKIATSLANFPERFDVVGVQEAQKSKRRHNGIFLAEKLGYDPGVWVNHNQKPHPKSRTGRKNEYIGLFGAQVGQAQTIELGDYRCALLTEIAGVAFATIHLRAGLHAHKKRRNQAAELVRILEPYENAVILGDFNEPPIRPYAKARAELARVGFRSVFDLTSQPHPKSFLNNSVAHSESNKRFATKMSLSLDDIYIRGEQIQVLDAGVLDRVSGGSDHDGLWASLKISDT